jgi:hypothetical protein
LFSSETTEPIDYVIKVWFQLSNWFQTRRFLCEFPIGSSYVKRLVIPTFNQDGRQARNRKKGDEIKKKMFSSETTEPISIKLC